MAAYAVSASRSSYACLIRRQAKSLLHGWHWWHMQLRPGRSTYLPQSCGLRVSNLGCQGWVARLGDKAVAVTMSAATHVNVGEQCHAVNITKRSLHCADQGCVPSRSQCIQQRGRAHGSAFNRAHVCPQVPCTTILLVLMPRLALCTYPATDG